MSCRGGMSAHPAAPSSTEQAGSGREGVPGLWLLKGVPIHVRPSALTRSRCAQVMTLACF